MATHSALRFHGNKDLRLETVARPRPGPRQVLVKVDFCAVCQTDVEEFLHGHTGSKSFFFSLPDNFFFCLLRSSSNI